MTNRKQHIETLLEDLTALKRHMIFRSASGNEAPRITPSQWGALMVIEQKGGSTLKDMATALGITSSAATQLVDGLVASGYVVREMHAEDRRAVTITLSKKTKAQVTKLKKQSLQRFLKVFAVLSDKEFTQYLALTKKIVTESLV